MRRLRGFRSRIAVIALCAAAAFAGGLVTSAVVLAGRYDPYRKLAVFSKVLSYIENNYVEDVPESELMYGAARGLTDVLDPHSRFMDPDEYERLKRETEGDSSITGIGVDLERRKRGLVVVSPIDGSPAFAAGLLPGDVIVKIDGTLAADLEWDEAVARIQGPEGSQVVLAVDRGGKELTFRIKRARFEVKTVEHRLLDDGYGYIKVRIFAENTDRRLQEAMEDLRGKAAKADPKRGLPGLILDLRRNPGGLLAQGVKIADRFVSKGLIVRTVGKGGREMDRQIAHARGTWEGFPMIVLVDGATASAAEIVAGALQDHERAVVMGTQTFGKGSVQTVMTVEGCGSRPCGLKLTVSRYYTPNGRSIQSQGITPDVLVEATAGESPRGDDDGPRERDFERHLKNEQGEAAPARKRDGDRQLQAALDYLRSWAVFSRQSGKRG